LTRIKSRTVASIRIFSVLWLFGGLNLLFVRIGDSPKDFEHKITKKTKGLSCHLYSLRFLGFLLFITFVPSVSFAVRIFGCGGAALGYWPFLPETNSGMLIGLMRNGCP